MDHTRYTLIERLKDQDDQAAWETFTQNYEGYIYTVLIRLGIRADDASDLRQDILLKLWKQLPEFEYQAEKGSFRSWLCTVIRNTAYSYFSSRKNEQKRIDSYFQSHDDSPSGSPQLDQLMDHEWKTYITNRAMQNLRASFNQQSITIFERSLDGESVESLAREFELQENTVYRIKNRVKERLIVQINRMRKELE
ncbi:RNA polymerase sigma factor [Verrucomicrobiaceae bacterium N1E253]|uniref:RNA polymerase sigma factor n=1 Tax=Oceaniferula marina TaxID=2748318 RepID=A0A851GFZ8_9BACT|nr:RNA polymerase sigma factor [Oceaniferula marina]NWK54721.1 RNA polymerase sigma factor [Oceaniferula marina]